MEGEHYIKGSMVIIPNKNRSINKMPIDLSRVNQKLPSNILSAEDIHQRECDYYIIPYIRMGIKKARRSGHFK